jgi:hypothetical protein
VTAVRSRSTRLSVRSYAAALSARLRLLQPEAHVHLAVHLRRGGELLAALLILACSSVELPEAEVAMGGEGAHPELLGERERVAVVVFGLVGVQRVALGGDLAKEAKGICLMSSFLMAAGEIMGMEGEPEGVLDSPRPQVSLALPADMT